MKKLIAFLILLGVAVPALAAITVPVNTVVSANKYLYVADATPGSSNIKIYNSTPQTPSLVAAINSSALGGSPTGMALSPNGNTLYAAIVNTSTVKIFSADTGVYLGYVSGTTFVDPRQLAVAPDGKKLYVVDQAARAVKVINVVENSDGSFNSATYNTSIIPNVSDLYGVAVSPDNTKIAISRRNAAGSVYLYNINRDSNGDITGYTLAKTLSGLMYPSYVVFTANSELLVVRIDETSSPYRDAIVYEAAGGFNTQHDINLIAANEQNVNNYHGEALAVSSNGQRIYMTHYRVSDGKVHGYSMSTVLSDMVTPRIDWTWNSSPNLDSEFVTTLLAPKDAAFVAPDGSRIWFTCSEGGAYMASKWTGFTETNDPPGNITNPIPKEPILLHPITGDNLLNYTGSAQYTYATNDPHVVRQYQVDYKEVGTDNWINLAMYTSDTSVSLSGLSLGKNYIVRVRMFGKMSMEPSAGGVWGPFAYSPQFRRALPAITKLQVDTNPDPNISTWVDSTEAIIYDHINIVGTDFGSDPGDGSRDTATNNVKIAGQIIRDDAGSNGLQVYAWSPTAIEIGIPRRISSTFINAGANAIIVTSNGTTTNSVNLNIKPHIYSISPDRGYAGDSPVVSGTALEGTRTVYFDAASAGAGTIVRENGDDPDGTNGSDNVTVVVPAGLTPGLKAVSATVNSLTSNNDVTFLVIDTLWPNITQIIPNAAPNTANINGVIIKGVNFQAGATVALRMSGQADIAGTVTTIEATMITVNLPINGKTVGKWDVVVTNPDTKTATKSKGFTITDGNGEIAQIIDDFEGIAVVYPGGYTYFPGPADINLTMSTTGVYEGAQSGAVTYPLSANGFRGYNGTLSTMQDISNFSTIIVAVKGDGGAGSIKVQLTDVSNKNFGAPSNTIPLSGTSWTKYSIPLSAFVEIDSSGNPVPGGATLNKAGITNYQLVFTGNAGSAATIGVDFVAAGGQTSPSDITTTIVRAGDTAGSDVTLNWVYSGDYAGNADIYAISGAWDAATGVFTTEAIRWGAPIATNRGGGTYTDNNQVGEGTQKYYKVVKTGVALTDAMLSQDVVGKFDLGIGIEPEKFFISLPLVPNSTSLTDVFGQQAIELDTIFIFDAQANPTFASKFSGGTWGEFAPGIPQISAINPGYAYGFSTTSSRYVTVVGKVLSTNNARPIDGAAVANWIGTAYPLPSSIQNASLENSTIGSSALDAATIYHFDSNANLLDGNSGMSVHTGNGQWTDLGMSINTTVVKPGKGYMFTDPGTGTTWTQQRPY
jgi:6-phosphogluconolactonase (cycloisomerase 2 family)